MIIAQEIQEMIRDLRKSSTVLKFFKLPSATSWKDLVVVGLGDQAHKNRPNCGSTGGMLIFLSGPQIMRGTPNPMVLVYWKTWRLKRFQQRDAKRSLFLDLEPKYWRSLHIFTCVVAKPVQNLVKSHALQTVFLVDPILG